MTQRTFAIVGGGLAGAKAAETLRKEGFDGRVVLVGDERNLPYERPPLSKEYLRGEKPLTEALVHDDAWYRDNNVELLTGTRVTHIETSTRRLTLDDGRTVDYDALLLATGAAPRRLDVPGGDLDGVRYLRVASDADAIRDSVKHGPVVVIGGGWIGAEVAASARQLGADVTLVLSRELPLERVLGKEVAAVYGAVHREHGVRLVSGRVERLEGAHAVESVVLADATRIAAQTVIAGIGVAPRLELARDAGLSVVGDGVEVNEFLESSVPNVFAAGDIANAWNPRYGERIRSEHWDNAKRQGATAARNMLGQRKAYDRVPYFYSDQFELGMEYSGHAPSWDQVVFRGDVDKREFIAFWVLDGAVVAGMNVNIWDVNPQIATIAGSRKPVNVERLTNADVPLEDPTIYREA